LLKPPSPSFPFSRIDAIALCTTSVRPNKAAWKRTTNSSDKLMTLSILVAPKFQNSLLSRKKKKISYSRIEGVVLLMTHHGDVNIRIYTAGPLSSP
jgi:hypothetical protein